MAADQQPQQILWRVLRAELASDLCRPGIKRGAAADIGCNADSKLDLPGIADGAAETRNGRGRSSGLVGKFTNGQRQRRLGMLE